MQPPHVPLAGARVALWKALTPIRSCQALTNNVALRPGALWPQHRRQWQAWRLDDPV